LPPIQIENLEMSRWKSSKLVRLTLFLFLFATMASFGYSILLKRPFLESLSHFLFLEGGILLIIFSLIMSRSLRAKYRDREEIDGWVRILGEMSILIVAFILILSSIIVSSLMGL